MRLLDWLDKILPGSAVQTTTGLTDNIRKQYVDEYMKREENYTVTFPGPDSLQKLVTAVDTNIISPEQARREMGIVDDKDDPYLEWATRSENQWRERAKSMQAKGKCLWCTVPYEDDSGSCTKCGAPKDIKEVEAVALMVSSTSAPS